jgi:hypothetical protein
MLWVIPVIALTVGQVPAVDASELVKRLGSDRFGEREAAAAALETLGADALPAIRAATDSNDLELRTRAESLRAKIESNELTRSSLIRLDVTDRPLDAIVADSESRWPSRLAWHPDTPEPARRRTVTVREPAPLPFWAAIDRLCRAGGLQYIPGSPDGPGSTIPQFRLFLAPGTAYCPRSDTGPLRFELTSIRHFRQINLIPNPSSAGGLGTRGSPPPPFGHRREDFHVELRVLAEPRMLISRLGEAHVAVAIDDLGHSLLPGGKPGTQNCALGTIPAQACIMFGLSMRHPERAGKLIKRLRMSIEVEVVARKPDRLVIPLAKARGKTFRIGKTSIQVIGLGTDPSGHPSVELKIAMDEETARRLTQALHLELPNTWGEPVRPEVTGNVIQVFDQHGRQFPWTGACQADGPSVSASLSLCPEGGPTIPEPTSRGAVPLEAKETAIPTELHYFDLARAIVRAPIEFSDIPMP